MAELLVPGSTECDMCQMCVQMQIHLSVIVFSFNSIHTIIKIKN